MARIDEGISERSFENRIKGEEKGCEGKKEVRHRRLMKGRETNRRKGKESKGRKNTCRDGYGREATGKGGKKERETKEEGERKERGQEGKEHLLRQRLNNTYYI